MPFDKQLARFSDAKIYLLYLKYIYIIYHIYSIF